LHDAGRQLLFNCLRASVALRCAHHAQYWDGLPNFAGEALLIARDIITGSHDTGGENKKLGI